MFIHKLQLTNFKRFTDLSLDLGDKNYKLVLLIGKNGSGKSSVFDAFEYLNTTKKNDGNYDLKSYYRKDLIREFDIDIIFNDKQYFKTNDSKINLSFKAKSFYGRSSLRQIPQLTRTALGQAKVDIELDSDRPRKYIDRDERFENDLERITKQVLEEVFMKNGNTSTEEIRARFVNPINESLTRIFKDSHNPLVLKALIPPLDEKVATILFEKGSSEFHYNLLSSGEKEIFNILINLLSRRYLYQDTIYFIDELDLHLNTTLQKNLLQEIVEHWLPENCQLWTASHSLGFIEYANETEHSAIIDFDDLNFDLPQVLYPEPKSHLKIFEVAVPQEMLLKIFQDKKIFICENQNDKLYNLLGLDKIIFVGVPNSNAVFIKIKNDNKYFGLRDRDFLTEDEIKKTQKHFPNYYILKYYCFENYLYHPENIAELNLKDLDIAKYSQEIIRQKNENLFNIIADFKNSRKTYEELKDDSLQYNSSKEKDRQEELIINDLRSDNFETFYKYFDMKKKFNKKLLEKMKIEPEDLAKTNWFKTQIQAILQ